MQRTCVPGGVTHRLQELELPQVRQEVAMVGHVRRHVVLRARVEILLATRNWRFNSTNALAVETKDIYVIPAGSMCIGKKIAISRLDMHNTSEFAWTTHEHVYKRIHLRLVSVTVVV